MIREYVAKIRNKEPEKCWPFASLGNLEHKFFALYHSAESINDLVESLVTDNNMCKTVYDQSLEENKCEYGKSVHEDTDDAEPEGLQMRKKCSKYRLLSDIYNDSASELRVCRDLTNPENVNSKFSAETEDENDDITLDNVLRKQMDFEITHSSKKRRNMIQDEKSTVDLDKKSSHGSNDSNGNGSVSGLGIHLKNENDDITFQEFSRKQKDVEINYSSKKRRKLIQYEKSTVDLDKKSIHGSNDSNGTGSVIGLRIHMKNENDDITFQEFSRRQTDVEINHSSTKRRKLIQDEKSTVDLDKKSRHGSDDSNGNGSVNGLRIQLRNDNRIDIDAQRVTERKKVISSPIVLSEKKGGRSSLDCKENTGQKDCRLSCHQQMNKDTESSNAQTTEQISEDSEMEVVMLLARHFNKENPSTSGQIETVCACVQKKIGTFSTPFTNKSVNTKISSKTAVTYADTCNKYIKEKLEKAICSDDHHSKLALRSATASMFLAKLENYRLKAARNVEKCSDLVCSVNRNPADFCNPNAHNKFMRGG
ncbi:uncharacterized protein [Rutidosis leptorrhynchoides]|uniref:uncharacterized protein isoform X2 n=1 Tax=Rutidosis leptorrhynchoides TaxID=125765 RepID=UPI003A9A616D